MLPKIIFYAASEKNIPREKIGGAEVGAKRTFDNMIKNGFDVLYVPKINLYYGLLYFIISYIKTYHMLKKIFKSKIYDFFYITSFYKRQAIIEKKFIKMAKKYGLKVLYEPKNGSFVKNYFSGNNKYKRNIDYCIQNSNLIFCQGIEYCDFMKEKSSARIVYIPNYVNEICDKEFVIDDVIDIIYFGRLVEEKNIDFIVKLCAEINKKHDCNCLLIGSGKDDYLIKINDLIKELKIENFVTVKNRMSLDEICDYALKSDFFVFPSSEEEEGHSNALTEAMNFGCIPIVSNNGFNKSVVGNEKYVIDELNLNKYRDKIFELYDDLINNKELVRKRVRENYIRDIIVNRQIDEIKKLGDE